MQRCRALRPFRPTWRPGSGLSVFAAAFLAADLLFARDEPEVVVSDGAIHLIVSPHFGILMSAKDIISHINAGMVNHSQLYFDQLLFAGSQVQTCGTCSLTVSLLPLHPLSYITLLSL